MMPPLGPPVLAELLVVLVGLAVVAAPASDILDGYGLI
jgi:hypothetical protein